MGRWELRSTLAGILYVANNGTTTIFQFSASSLPVVNPSTTTPTSTALTPAVTLSDNGSGSIQAPWALAMDGNGNLWSSNANAPNTVVEFTRSQIADDGKPDAEYYAGERDGEQ